MVKLAPRLLFVLALALLLPACGIAQKAKMTTLRSKGHLWTSSMKIPSFDRPTPVQAYAMKMFKKDATLGFADFQKQSSSARGEGVGSDSDYSYDSEVTITYASKDVVSGYTNYELYMGGAHGSTSYTTRIFVLKNGKPTELKAHDVFVSKKAARNIAHEYVAVPIVRKRGAVPDNTFANEVPETDMGAIVLTKEGIMWIIPPYDMDSYAAGTYMKTAPWSALKSAVKWSGPMKQLASLASKKR